MINTCPKKKHQLTPLIHVKDNIILENFSKPVTLRSLYPSLSNFDPQNEAPENFQIPHFLSLSCSFKSNFQNQHLLFNPLSLSLTHTPKLSSTYKCRFYFLATALLSPTFGSDHRKSPPPLPILTTSRYSLFVGNFLILFSKWMDGFHHKLPFLPNIYIWMSRFVM